MKEMELLIAGLALLVSLLSVFIARSSAAQAKRSADTSEKSYRYARLNAKAELFVALRATYLAIHNSFPRTKSCVYEEYRNNFRAYWVNSYNEWYITRKICPSYGLWEEFFHGAICGALGAENFTRALREMLDEGFAFGSNDLKQEFLVDIGFGCGQGSGSPPNNALQATREDARA